MNNVPSQAADEQREADLIQRVCAFIDAHDAEPTLAELGAHVGFSPFHLQRVFKRATGITPRQYAEGRRIERFKAHLRAGSSVTTALYDSGYRSSSRAYERAPERMGMTPAIYSKGGAGMEIAYATRDCRVQALRARVIVAWTARGVCAVHLGENDAELLTTLQREYPQAHIQHVPGQMCDWVTAIIRHLLDWREPIELPLDLQATTFQLWVWEALRAIPYGETRTYGEIAAEIGHPGAAQQVAKAIYDNPIAVIIPCHRTARADGDVSVYYDPRQRKARRLLRDEEQHTISVGMASGDE
ncbi:MAG: methylated-DNA--[protein]-cysteine S-methyltransferase [Chloroflexota bacterium]|nr:methylated-DNA--[protein]-cysteine S-methyltransferase [Chloroflexota bacterium]